MQFRPATNGDAERVRDLVFSILEEYGLRSDPAGTDLDLADIEGHYAARGGCFEVLMGENGKLVGCYGLYPLRKGVRFDLPERPEGCCAQIEPDPFSRTLEGVCELRKMYLRRDHRGRGLGKTILRRAIDQARSLGFRDIRLETAAVLVEAVALYAAFGFRSFQPDHMSSRCNLAMRLELPAVDAG